MKKKYKIEFTEEKSIWLKASVIIEAENYDKAYEEAQLYDTVNLDWKEIDSDTVDFDFEIDEVSNDQKTTSNT